jgi:serine protease Do
VFRRGGTRELSVTIAEIESDKPVRKANEKESKPKASSAGQALGLSVSELSDAVKKELKVKGGVRVDAATEAAARAGIREGDVIVSVANAEIGSIKDFEAAVAKADKNKALAVLIRRGEMAQIAVIRPAR